MGRRSPAGSRRRTRTSRRRRRRSTRARARPRKIAPRDQPYLVVYPFVKVRPWYALPEDGPPARDGRAHPHRPRGVPRDHNHTTYSFGIDDQEFMTAFECDEPADFMHLMLRLRDSEASRYTERDTPIFVGQLTRHPRRARRAGRRLRRRTGLIQAAQTYVCWSRQIRHIANTAAASTSTNATASRPDSRMNEITARRRRSMPPRRRRPPLREPTRSDVLRWSRQSRKRKNAIASRNAIRATSRARTASPPGEARRSRRDRGEDSEPAQRRVGAHWRSG